MKKFFYLVFISLLFVNFNSSSMAYVTYVSPNGEVTELLTKNGLNTITVFCLLSSGIFGYFAKYGFIGGNIDPETETDESYNKRGGYSAEKIAKMNLVVGLSSIGIRYYPKATLLIGSNILSYVIHPKLLILNLALSLASLKL